MLLFFFSFAILVFIHYLHLSLLSRPKNQNPDHCDLGSWLQNPVRQTPRLNEQSISPKVSCLVLPSPRDLSKRDNLLHFGVFIAFSLIAILYIQWFWELGQKQTESLEPRWQEQEGGRCGQEQIYNMGDSTGSSPCWVTSFSEAMVLNLCLSFQFYRVVATWHMRTCKYKRSKIKSKRNLCGLERCFWGLRAFAVKHNGMSSIPSTPIKIQAWCYTCLYPQCHGKETQGDLWGYLGSQSSQWAPGSVRHSLNLK